LALETDTRQPLEGCLFVALVGPTFNGQTFASQAFGAGAQAVMLTQGYWQNLATETAQALQALGPVLLVEDTLVAYQALAQAHRQVWGQQAGRCVVALTGSSGKTTVKEWLLHTLAPYKRVQGTEKNFNNDIGAAHTLLSLRPETEVLVLEMGMRGLGEIARLARMAQPNVGLLLNVGPAHIERLGSLEAIAEAKCELVEGLNPASATLVFNEDDPLISQRLKQLSWAGKAMPFNRQQVQALQEPETTSTLCCPCPLEGAHQVLNWAAVWQTALAVGLSTEQVMAAQNPPPRIGGRYEHMALSPALSVVWDAYNANPASMHASLATFLSPTEPTPQRWLVLGAMGELGPHWEGHYHGQLFEALATWAQDASTGLAGCTFIGKPTASDTPSWAELLPSGFPLPWAHFETTATCLASPHWAQLRQSLTQEKDTPWQVLFKGSRAHQLEVLLEDLKHHALP
jgi:UDP-N-acetylmuramoyl-tripeptide--D-alanyl-D-alanine ligase